MNTKEGLSRQEWTIMEALWLKGPMFLSQIMDATQGALNWSKSTYSTYLKKMCGSSYLDYETISGNRLYRPLATREECIRDESRSARSKMTDISAKMFLTCFLKESGLNREDREELQELIQALGREEREREG